MHGGLILKYMNSSASPEHRAGEFVVGEKRLTWSGLLFDQFPQAEIYLVGGTLRDALLGKQPKDIDIVIRGIEPTNLEHWLNRHGAAEFVGRFGTFKFIPHGCGGMQPIDIALPRTEHIGPEHKSARTDMNVKFDHTLSIQDDLARRDFTINAIAFDIKNNRIIDPFFGIKDLQAGLIQAVLVPEQRFYEDATRMLRGLRFASQLGFGIEEFTWKAIAANIELLNSTTTDDEGLFKYSVPREAIGREFLLGFTAHPVHTLKLWSESHALHLFMPQLVDLEMTPSHDNEPALHKTQHILHLLTKPTLLDGHRKRKVSPSVLVAGLMSFLGEDKRLHAQKICVDLHFHQFSKDHSSFVDCKQVLWFSEHLHMFEQVDPASLRPSEFERLFVNDRGQDLLLLMQAFYIATGKHSVARERVQTAKRIRGRFLDVYRHAGDGEKLPNLISGRDLKELHLEPGPHFRSYLDAIRDEQLTGKIKNRNEAIEKLRSMITSN